MSDLCQLPLLQAIVAVSTASNLVILTIVVLELAPGKESVLILVLSSWADLLLRLTSCSYLWRQIFVKHGLE